MDKYKIIERNGIFIVFYSYKTFSLFKFKMIEKWDVAHKEFRQPAHFKTLKKAKKFINKIQKKDIEYFAD